MTMDDLPAWLGSLADRPEVSWPHCPIGDAAIPRPWLMPDVGGLPPRSIDRHRRDAAIAATARVLDGCRVIDGVLWRPSEAPVVAVSLTHDARLVEVRVEVPGLDYAIPDGGVAFAVAQRDRLESGTVATLDCRIPIDVVAASLRAALPGFDVLGEATVTVDPSWRPESRPGPHLRMLKAGLDEVTRHVLYRSLDPEVLHRLSGVSLTLHRHAEGRLDDDAAMTEVQEGLRGLLRAIDEAPGSHGTAAVAKVGLTGRAWLTVTRVDREHAAQRIDDADREVEHVASFNP